MTEGRLVVELRENDIVIDTFGEPWRIEVEDDPELFPVPSLWAFRVFNPKGFDLGKNVASLAQPVVLVYRKGEPCDRIVEW